MHKKLALVCVLITVFVLTMAGLASAKSFDDVPRSHWAYDAVEYLASKGLVEGYPDGTYQGDKMMNRYELAMLVARAYAKMEDMMGKGEKASIDVEAIMNDLMDEFEPELNGIRKMVKANSIKIEDLDKKLKENAEMDADLAAKLAKLGSKFKFNGILKLRADAKYWDPGDREQHRPRFSFRFDMSAPVNDEITFGGRLGTGNVGARVGTETTYTGLFGIKALDIERAFVVWKPSEWPNWTFTGGKFKTPWATSANFFDADVNVEGMSFDFQGEHWLFNLTGMAPANKGGYIVAQVGAEDLFWDQFDAYLTYHYASSGAFETLWTAFPYWFRLDADNYSAIEGYAKYGFEWYNWPIAVQAQYRMNLADEWAGFSSGLQQAAMAQVTVGKIKEVHDYNFWINYGRVLPNALIPQFAHSTYGVDGQTWGVGFGYKPMEHVLFKLWYAHKENLVASPNNSWNYFCADMIFDF